MTTVMNRTLTAQGLALCYALDCLARVAAYAGHTWGGVWENSPPPDDYELSEDSISEWVKAHSEEGPCGWGVTAPSLESLAGFLIARVHIGRGVEVRADVDGQGEVVFAIALTSRGDVQRGTVRTDNAAESGWVYIPPTDQPGLLRDRDVARFVILMSKLYDFDINREDDVLYEFERDIFGGITADRDYLHAPNAGHLLAGEKDPAVIVAEARQEAAAGHYYAARAALLALGDDEFVQTFLL